MFTLISEAGFSLTLSPRFRATAQPKDGLPGHAYGLTLLGNALALPYHQARALADRLALDPTLTGRVGQFHLLPA